MAKFRYTPDQDVKVHEEGAIRLLCKAFQSHEDGLPEWLKNSSDAYAREDTPEAERIIIVLFDSGRLSRPASISCLDFSGMTTEMIEENFRVWADPEAAIRGGLSEGVQGGHGNGGKCYMSQMFEDCSFLHSVKNGRGNRYGVEGGSIRFGYIPDRETGRQFPVPNLRQELDKILREVNCNLSIIQRVADMAVEKANGFTLVTGISPKGYSRGIPIEKLIEGLQEHPQMISTIELCKVYTVINGKMMAKALALPDIQPMFGGEEPRVILIPDIIKDPISCEEVSTTDDGAFQRGTLLIKTSDKSMRWKKKGRHNVIYKARSGYIGQVPVSELDIQSSYRDNIYGECYLESLEMFKTNERRKLADSPLTRAVEAFISDEIQKYAKEFENRDRKRYDREEKSAISKINEALDRWKNQFLDEMLRGMWGSGGVGPPPPQPPLPVGKPAILEVNLSHSNAGLGVAFRPTIKFFDKDGKRIRPVAYHWCSEDNNVAIVDQDLMVVNTFAFGQTRIWAETENGKVRSNAVPLQVVRILDIAISPREIEIAVGTRQKLDAICQLANGQQTSDVYLEWMSNSDIARVSSAGLVFGFAPGETQVIAADDKCQAKEPAIVKVVPGKGRGPGDKPGKGYPRVLVSGEIDRDPDTQEYRHFSKEYPPIAQDPIDAERNIWWINSAAPLAQLYLDSTKDYGYDSREWRMYHLERYIDVIVQIALTHGPTESESLSVNDWIMKWGYQDAQIQAAAAADLREFIATGRLPE